MSLRTYATELIVTSTEQLTRLVGATLVLDTHGTWSYLIVGTTACPGVGCPELAFGHRCLGVLRLGGGPPLHIHHGQQLTVQTPSRWRSPRRAA